MGLGVGMEGGGSELTGDGVNRVGGGDEPMLPPVEGGGGGGAGRRSWHLFAATIPLSDRLGS